MIIYLSIYHKNIFSVPRPWLTWEQWTPCTVTCEGGTRIRRRECLRNVPDDIDVVYEEECEGDPSETERCHTYSCTKPHGKFKYSKLIYFHRLMFNSFGQNYCNVRIMNYGNAT